MSKSKREARRIAPRDLNEGRVVMAQKVSASYVFVISGMVGGVLGIASGLLLPADWTEAKLYIPLAIFFASSLSGALYFAKHGSQDSRNLSVLRAVLMVWLLLPISAGMNAFAFAIGVYNPIQHDAYPKSMAHWWTGIGALIALGLACTTLYLRADSLVREPISMRPYVAASWICQVIIMIIWLLV